MTHPDPSGRLTQAARGPLPLALGELTAALAASPSVADMAEVPHALQRLCEPVAGLRLLEEVDPGELLSLGEALVRRLTALSSDSGRADSSVEASPLREAVWAWLDATRRSRFLRRIASREEGPRWLDLVLTACEVSHYTTGTLLSRRAATDPDRVWLRVVQKERIREHSVGAVRAMVDAFARGLHSLWTAPPEGQPVAILAENSLETAIADLACLCGGLVNTTIPADVWRRF